MSIEEKDEHFPDFVADIKWNAVILHLRTYFKREIFHYPVMRDLFRRLGACPHLRMKSFVFRKRNFDACSLQRECIPIGGG